MMLLHGVERRSHIILDSARVDLRRHDFPNLMLCGAVDRLAEAIQMSRSVIIPTTCRSSFTTTLVIAVPFRRVEPIVELVEMVSASVRAEERRLQIRRNRLHTLGTLCAHRRCVQPVSSSL
jgi:hypothetical protein